MLCKRYKEEYDGKIEENSKKLNYSNKNEETHKKARREVHIAQAVWEFYPDLKEAGHDDPDL